jgi:hypothetical protein
MRRHAHRARLKKIVTPLGPRRRSVARSPHAPARRKPDAINAPDQRGAMHRDASWFGHGACNQSRHPDSINVP